MIIAFLPRRFLERLCADPAGRWHWNVVLSHALLLMALPFAAALFTATDRLPHVCVAKWLGNIPCPGCGVTTGLRQLSQGRSVASWAANPATMVLAVGVPLQLLLHGLALARRTYATLCNRVSNRLNASAATVLIGVWLLRLC